MFQGHHLKQPTNPAYDPWLAQQRQAAFIRDAQDKARKESKKRVIKMSGAIWCNINDPETNVKGQVGHAFSDQDPDAQQYRQTRKVKQATGNSYGQTTYQDREEVTTVIDMCGYHVRKQMPFQADNEQAPAIEASIEDAEKDALEAERDMWRDKYDAERGRGTPVNPSPNAPLGYYGNKAA
jgi:hypothetical protein